MTRMERLRDFLIGERGTRWLAVGIASAFVASVASVGQVSSRSTNDGRMRAVAESGEPGLGPGTSGVAGTGDPDTQDPGAAVGTDGTGTGGSGGGGAGGSGGSGSGGSGSGGDTGGRVFEFGLRTQGVTAKEVKLGISYNTTGCGDAGLLEAMVGAGAAGDMGRAIDAFTRYTNDHGGVGGRKLKVVVADDGGGGCPEKALSAARQLVDDDKVFAVIPGLHEVSDYVASKKVPTFIGRDDPASLARLGANGIGLTQEIGGNLKAWAAFGRNYLRSDQHVPCLIHPEAGVSGDWPLYEKILVDRMRDNGLAFKDIVVYKEDVQTAQQQSSAAIARLKAKGCDQLYFMAGNPISLIFFTQAAENAQWRPTWTFTSYMALADSELGGRLMNQAQWQNAVGLSTRVLPGEHPLEANCKHIYESYYPNDGQSESVAAQLVCAYFLPAAEMMRRGERLTGRLDANALLAGADSIKNDFYFDAHVPLRWEFDSGGPYKSKGWSHYTVVRWNSTRSAYDFPEYPIYWEVMGPNKSNGVDLRPLFQKK